MNSHDHVFTLRVTLGTSLVIIDAYDRPAFDRPWALEVEVRHEGKVIFPRGQLYCGAAALGERDAQDSDVAKELVMSLVGMKPGDTDRDYFADYTAEQLAWAEAHGEAINLERMRLGKFAASCQVLA